MSKKESKFAKFVVKGRYWFLGIFFVLLVASAIMMNFVNVNYDLTKYLPDNSTTKESVELMKEEFGSTGTASLMLSNVTQAEAQNIANKIGENQNVATSVLSRFQFVEGSATNGYALISIFLTDGDFTTEASDTLDDIEVLMAEQLGEGQNYYLTGSAVTAGASRSAIMGQIPLIMAMAVLVVLLVLLFTTRSWIEPVILLIVIGTAILINMGTNCLLGEISFISNSVSSVLLIALAMDYSIVLVNRFREEREKEPDLHIAMQNTIKGSIVTILSSGLTVMAGLVSLVFMDYKIGLDLGLVLTKGVFISILAVIFLMPAILLLFSKLLKKTEHKNFLKGLGKVGNFAKATRWVMPALFLVIMVCAFTVQNTMLDFNYVAKFSNNGDKVFEDEQNTAEVFGEQNTLVLMFGTNPDNTGTLSYEQQMALFESIKNLELEDGTKPANNPQASSFATSGTNGVLLGSALNAIQLQYGFGLTAEQSATAIYLSGTQYGFADAENTTVYACNIIKCLATNDAVQATLSDAQKQQIGALFAQEQVAESVFNSQNYTRMIFNIDATQDSEIAIAYVNKLHEFLETQTIATNLNCHIVNNTQNVIETQEVFRTDRIKVELISALAILLIVCIAFRSVSLPIILVLVIEGAIWINLAGNALLGNSLFFICYLLGTAIQMGATIDYGILLSDRYVEARRTQNKYEAIKTAIDKSFPTILSSGTILTLAAFCIGIFSTVPLLSSIGYLIGFGALCASLSILFVLPQILLILDKPIAHTTLHSNFCFPQSAKNTSQQTKVVQTTAQPLDDPENTKTDDKQTTRPKKRGRPKKI